MSSLRIRDLSYQYPRSRQPVLDGASLEARAGEMVAVTGPSGCGKSTLLFCAGLMLRPRRGSVRFDDVERSAGSDRQRSRFRARDIGFVFQDARLDRSRTVMSNVCEPAVYARRHRRDVERRAEALLSAVGVDVPERRPGNGLSGGQAQRVALCRALVCEPRFILADEPTGNLDAANEDLVLAELGRQAAEGRIVVVVTHSERVIAFASRVVELGLCS